MVVRSRLRSVAIPLAFYAFAGGVAWFFIHHAHNGSRGLETRQSLKIEAYGLRQELDQLRATRTEWEQRVAMYRDDALDRDLLEERARDVLGRAHRNDIIVLETMRNRD